MGKIKLLFYLDYEKECKKIMDNYENEKKK